MTAPDSPSRANRMFGFAVAGAGAFMITASSSAPSPLYPVYQQMWGFSPVVLTVVFAVYVLALLATMLTVGSLSDRIGRRPVIAVAFAILAASMVLFIVADGVGWLIVARIVQGIGVGAAMSALAAAVIDLQPNGRLGPLVNSIAPSLGLALGAAGAGMLVQFAPFPTTLTYAVLAALVLAFLVSLVFVPETSPAGGFASRGEALRTLLPNMSVPREVRAPFLLVLPNLMSAWALGGLYMSLGPSIVDSVFGVEDRLAAGLAIAALFTSGTVAATMLSGRDSHRVVVFGGGVLAAGLAVVVAALFIGWTPMYYVGTVIAGFGWGATFGGAMSVIGALGRPEQRGRIFATTFAVCYLAFSVPAMVAGAAAGAFGLMATAVGYSVVVATVALVAGSVLMVRRTRARHPAPTEVPAPAEGRALP